MNGVLALLTGWLSDEALHLPFPQFQCPLQDLWRQPSTFGLDLKLEALIACSIQFLERLHARKNDKNNEGGSGVDAINPKLLFSLFLSSLNLI